MTAKEFKRQYRSQVKAGLCVKCGDPATHGRLCEWCRVKEREGGRRRYRAKVGIVADSDLLKSGRPRVEAKTEKGQQQ